MCNDGAMTIRTYYERKFGGRGCDWEAVRGDYDLGCLRGFGNTEAEAIANLLEQEEECA